jgi:hypothetical protein
MQGVVVDGRGTGLKPASEVETQWVEIAHGRRSPERRTGKMSAVGPATYKECNRRTRESVDEARSEYLTALLGFNPVRFPCQRGGG